MEKIGMLKGEIADYYWKLLDELNDTDDVVEIIYKATTSTHFLNEYMYLHPSSRLYALAMDCEKLKHYQHFFEKID